MLFPPASARDAMPRAMLPVPMMVMSMLVLLRWWVGQLEVRAVSSTAMSQGSCTSTPPAYGSVAIPARSMRASTSASACGRLEHDRPVTQADGCRRRRRHAHAAPDVDRDVVVVAVGGHERRGRHPGHDARTRARRGRTRSPRSTSPTCRCRWPTVTPGSAAACSGSPATVSSSPFRSSGLGPPSQPGLREVGPHLARAVGGELDLVAVGVGQVDRLGDAVVGRADDRRARLGEPGGGAGQLQPRRVQQRDVVEAGVAARRARRRLADEHEQVVAAAGPERGGVAVAIVHAQADRALVERDRAIEVGDGQMGGAEPRVVAGLPARPPRGGVRGVHEPVFLRAQAVRGMAGPPRCMDFRDRVRLRRRGTARGRPPAPRRRRA